ncbi:glycosyltransferase family 39 protein [Myxosarcina sp. GI1]|uniref:glycosyltransferase family 39 protein n=1 Tax=Myxosarcina sp. GI1 TaxID=1541065 RepID=UPI0005606D75|nr:glycosyltransferase family 39 protein [Myxosarcina sp. GI1]
MKQQHSLSWQQGLAILVVIWFIGAFGDRLWLAIDNSVPDWDRADYLNGVLNYAHTLQTPQWLNGEWWREFWLLTNKIPPFHYILTAPFFQWLGRSQDAATTVMLVYSSILLVSVYGLGVILFNPILGLWAAGLCQLMPGLYYYRLEFLLDYPLTAMVTLSFWLLTIWKFKNTILTAILFGVSFGLAILLKQTALFFLLVPLLWLLATCLKNRQWWRLTQLISSLFVAVAISFPWYRTNWLLILTSGKRATVDSAIAEGDPALNTLAAWTYYAKVLPDLISWHLLIISLAGFIFFAIYKFSRNKYSLHIIKTIKWRWLTVFLIGGYLLSSLNINKDARYILPLLPVLSLILAAGLLSWTGRWRRYIRWGTICLAVVLMLLNLFSLGGNYLTGKFSHYPYTGKPYPNPEVINTIIDTSPYLRSTLGVLPSTPVINQHNFSFYGGLKDFQVFGRQVGVREDEVVADARSLDWFVTKTGDQGSIPDAQPAIVDLVESGGDFNLHQSWQLPDNSSLNLYHRKLPLVEVDKISTDLSNNKISLQNIFLPKISPSGVPIPVTYQWVGNWSELQSGIVLLTWENSSDNSFNFWLHDHSFGMGALETNREIEPNSTFRVVERTAMLPPDTIAEGEYTLKATYLNRNTGQTYPIDIPPVTLEITNNATAKPAPELDLVTQLRAIAPKMADSITALEPIFAQTARINQYDGRQDYLRQTELALSYRLQHGVVSSQHRLDWLYTVALSQVLQQDVDGAIASFNQITELAPQNPYGYAYLAFVYLYDWQPQAATKELNIAAELNPNIPEVKTLQGVAALMQGNLVKAWNLLK